MSDTLYDDTDERVEEYCDLCEREGHTFPACPARDDEYDQDGWG